MAFDYEAQTEVSDDVVRKIAAEMSGGGLKPLSDDERLEREAWREQRAQERALADEQRKIERERQQEVAEEIARSEAAAEIAEANRKARLELQERNRERQRDHQITELHYRARQAELWQSNVDAAARNAVAYRERQTLMNELESAISPPPPPPEPEATIVYGQGEGSPDFGPDFNPALFNKKPRPWF